MSFLTTLVDQLTRRQTRAASFDFLRRSSTDMPPIPHGDQALAESTVFACVDLIASTIAAMPWDAIRSRSGWREVVEPPPTLVVQPSALVDRVEFAWALLAGWMLHGFNLLRVVGADRFGTPTALELVSHSAVQLIENRDGLTIRAGGEKIAEWPEGPWVYWPILVRPGSRIGRSVIEHAAETIGVSMQTNRTMRTFVGRGAHPTWAILHKGALTDEQAHQLKARARASVADGGPMVASGDVQLVSLQLSPKDAALIDLLGATAPMIARVFRVPPEAIGVASQGTGSVIYANVETRALHLLVFTLRPWIVRLERAISSLLPRGISLRIRPEGILATDVKTRSEVYESALRNGWMTIDEVRALEDRPPLVAQQILDEQAAEAAIARLAGIQPLESEPEGEQ